MRLTWEGSPDEINALLRLLTTTTPSGPMVEVKAPVVEAPAPAAEAQPVPVRAPAQRVVTAVPPPPLLRPQPEPAPAPPIRRNRYPKPIDPSGVPARLAPFVNRHARNSKWLAANPLSDADFAGLAACYVEIVAQGKVPPQVIGSLLGISPEGVQQRIQEVRRRGLLTPSPRPKRPGGQLTDKARALLADQPDGDFYEDDEPVEKIEADFEAGQQGVTAAPAPIEPTAEQRAAIAAMNAEGRRIVQALQRGPSPLRAQLPERCSPVTLNSVDKGLRTAFKSARKAGWAIGKGPSGHVEWHGPRGEYVRTSSTFGDVKALPAALSDLRNAGIQVR